MSPRPKSVRPGRGRMPNCQKLRPLCRGLCCRMLEVDLKPHETYYPSEISEGKRVLPKVTIHEDLYPGGERVCVFWNTKGGTCSLKLSRKKVPQNCAKFTCLDHPRLWDTIERRLAMQKQGKVVDYDPEDRLMSAEELKAARNEVNRLNRLRKG